MLDICAATLTKNPELCGANLQRTQHEEIPDADKSLLQADYSDSILFSPA